MLRRHAQPRPETPRPRGADPARRRSTLPWTTVAAGGVAVATVVSLAGVVGAATGGSRALAPAGTPVEQWAAEFDLGAPVVTPDDGSSGGPGVVPDGAGLPDDVDRAPMPREPALLPDGSAGEPAAPLAPSTTEPSDAEPSADPTSPADPAPPGTATGPSADPEEAPTADGPAADAPAGPLAPGATGPDVAWLQERLRAHGAALALTGTFDAATGQALREFQRAAGLDPDGVLTAATVRALTADPPPPGAPDEGGATPDPGAGDDPGEDAGDGTDPPAGGTGSDGTQPPTDGPGRDGAGGAPATPTAPAPQGQRSPAPAASTTD